MRKTALFTLVVVLLLPAAANAGDDDLKQTIADLTGQTRDKERMDTLGAVKIEISDARTWLAAASNAVKESDEDKCRQLLTRIRLQLVLIDQLVGLSQIKARAEKLTKEIRDVHASVRSAKTELEQKQAKVRALKMANPG
jgi:hypothetical protein